MKTSTVLFADELPTQASLGDEVLLIYDQILPRKSLRFKKWLKGFSLTYGVKSGEDLKAVESFASHITRINKLCENSSSRNLTIVVVGGGSVGDFGGFVASVLKRGVKLIHIPSTWLAAIDSAHGGKTALNLGSLKNQIGTFYPAHKIFLVRALLLSQPVERAFEGFGELLKISWISGGQFWKQLAREADLTPELLWKYLKPAIAGKYKVVAKDPEEKMGYRHLLNLGHTVGHVLESYFKLPHGIAINYGLDFSLRWSLQKKILTEREYLKMRNQLVMNYLLSPARDQLLPANKFGLKSFRLHLMNDKKKTKSETLRFVFLAKPGHCVIKEVQVDEVLHEVMRQRKESANG